MDERDNNSGGQPYTPMHEKLPENMPQPPAENVDIPIQESVQQPVYDEFMYQPIGLDEMNGQNGGDHYNNKKKRSGGEKAAIILFGFLTAFSLVAATYGIVSDIVRSKEAIDKMSTQSSKVVLYRTSKPDGANDLSNFRDENGKYTVEGAAAAVMDSIVEIYTYSDASHNKYAGSGSGIVASEDGYIITNAHVLLSDGYHTVKTKDGETYEAKIVGRDVKTDIAIIKVSDAKLTPAEFGNSDETIVGEHVIAVGNPAGLSFSVTDGIVSHVGRKVRGESNNGFEMECIQTNAEISPGNSGGALVNMYGQVIGITSSKLVSSTLEGLGFAISINEAMPIIEELLNNGYVSGRFRIGVTVVDTSTDSKRDHISEWLGYAVPEDFNGIFVKEISEDSDLRNTELKTGDFIVEINGKSVKKYSEFYDTISSQYTVGDKVPATCAHIDKNGEISYYHIEFGLIEDRSGNY